MKKSVCLFTFMTVFTLFISINSYAEGWKQDSKGWRYYLDNYNGPGGDYIKDNDSEIDEEKYRFDENGYMITGWWHNDYYDDWYYYDESGKMLKTSLAYKGVTYYFDPETGKCLNKDGDKVSEFVLAYRNWQIKHDKFVEDKNILNEKEDIDKLISIIDELYNLPSDIPQNYLYELEVKRKRLGRTKNILLYKKELIELSEQPEFNQAKMKEVMKKITDELYKEDEPYKEALFHNEYELD